MLFTEPEPTYLLAHLHNTPMNIYILSEEIIGTAKLSDFYASLYAIE